MLSSNQQVLTKKNSTVILAFALKSTQKAWAYFGAYIYSDSVGKHRPWSWKVLDGQYYLPILATTNIPALSLTNSNSFRLAYKLWTLLRSLCYYCAAEERSEYLNKLEDELKKVGYPMSLGCSRTALGCSFSSGSWWVKKNVLSLRWKMYTCIEYFNLKSVFDKHRTTGGLFYDKLC